VQCSNEITITIINMGRKFRGRAWSPFNTKSPGPRPTSIPSGILIYAAIWPQWIWAENWGLCPFLGEGRAGSPSNIKSPGLRPGSIPSGILIHGAIWPQQTWAENWVGMCPFGGGELGPHLTQCGQGRGLPVCQVSS